MTSRTTLIAAMLGLTALAAPAMADGFGFGFDYQSRKGKGFGFSFDFGRPAPVVVAPAPVVVAPAPVVVTPPPVVVQRVWVPPVYRTVVERVWVPTSHTAFRDVPVVDARGRVISYRREAYTVHGGHWQEVRRQVCVREGYWTSSAGPAAGGLPADVAGCDADEGPMTAHHAGPVDPERMLRETGHIDPDSSRSYRESRVQKFVQATATGR